MSKTYLIKGVGLDLLHKESRTVLDALGGHDTKERAFNMEQREISAVMPTRWGWGNMMLRVGLDVVEDGTKLTLLGSVDHMAITALAREMDLFFGRLATILRDRHHLEFSPQKLSTFLPDAKLRITGKDRLFFQSLGGLLFAAVIVFVVSRLLS